MIKAESFHLNGEKWKWAVLCWEPWRKGKYCAV